ncbi:MAG: Hsp20 family protein [Alphaproteobacteria bacterium]|nr:Hsp20 family protein [Alphaproteobacteria bacterium]
MTNLSVFTPLMRQTVGFDRFNDLFETMLDNADERFDSYPPYNIEKLGENAYRITLAVAGFTEADLDITVHDDTLKVSGRKQETEDENSQNWLHRGIATRAFERTFRLADYIQVGEAKLENGLLTISMTREVPEEKKPRLVPINGKSAGLLGKSKKK